MVESAAREAQAGANVALLQIGQLLADLLGGQAAREQVKDIADTNSHPTDTWPPTALLGVDGDSFVEVDHDLISVQGEAGPSPGPHNPIMPDRPLTLQWK